MPGRQWNESLAGGDCHEMAIKSALEAHQVACG